MLKRWLIVGTTASVVMIHVAIQLLPTSAQQSPDPSQLSQNPKEFVDEVWQLIDRNYIDPTFNGQDWKAVRQRYLNRSYSSKEEAYQTIKEMLTQLGDPMTRFMTPEEFQKLQVQTAGDETSGVGLQLIRNQKTQELVVASPIELGSAYTAGILPGDILVKIDGQSTEGIHPYDAETRLQGPVGTPIVLTVRRGQKELVFKVTRKLLEASSVLYRSQKTPQGQIGYIRLSQFKADAAEKMRQAIQDLERQQVTGYILDLRTNPGGLLYSIIEIARMWLQNGTIVSTFDRQGERDRQVANQKALTDKPLVILVNEATESGSEILTAALQENRRATLVGSQTAGYNSIQSVRGVKAGGGLAITIAKWRTPKGRDLAGAGITPDVVVSLTPEQQVAMIRERSAGTSADPQYARAVDTLTQLLRTVQKQKP